MQALDGNQASIREVCDAGLLAGAVTVVWQHGEVLQVNEIGYRDVDAGLPMRRDTLFRIASMTKPVTVAAVMSLVGRGQADAEGPDRALGRRNWPTCRCWTTRTVRWTGRIRQSGRS